MKRFHGNVKYDSKNDSYLIDRFCLKLLNGSKLMLFLSVLTFIPLELVTGKDENVLFNDANCHEHLLQTNVDQRILSTINKPISHAREPLTLVEILPCTCRYF